MVGSPEVRSSGGRSTNRLVFRDYLESLMVAVTIAFLLRSFVFTSLQVTQPLMEPGLKPGDIILVYKLKYLFPNLSSDSEKNSSMRLPRRGEVIAFHNYGQSSANSVSTKNWLDVQRVVGLPGDRLEISKSRLIVNAKILDYQSKPQTPSVGIEQFDEASWPIIKPANQDFSWGPQIIPPGEIAVLGDDRSTASPQRVALKDILGQVVLVAISFDAKQGHKVRWHRILRKIK